MCKRNGRRGNENLVDGLVLCDDCTAEYLWFKGVGPEPCVICGKPDEEHTSDDDHGFTGIGPIISTSNLWH